MNYIMLFHRFHARKSLFLPCWQNGRLLCWHNNKSHWKINKCKPCPSTLAPIQRPQVSAKVCSYVWWVFGDHCASLIWSLHQCWPRFTWKDKTRQKKNTVSHWFAYCNTYAGNIVVPHPFKYSNRMREVLKDKQDWNKQANSLCRTWHTNTQALKKQMFEKEKHR